MVSTVDFELGPSALIGACFVIGEGETVFISVVAARGRPVHNDPISLWTVQPLQRTSL